MSFNSERETGHGLLFATWKFTRPHTIRGTLLSSFVGVLRAYFDNAEEFHRIYREGGDFAGCVIRMLLGVVALVCGNAFIVGINQVYDVGIDKINKPYLPIASGELSSFMGWFLTLGSGMVGLLIVTNSFPPLISWLYAFGLLLGVMYSVPPFRWKSSPFFAMISIAIARGILLNFGVYFATLAALDIPFWLSPAELFLVTFMTIYAASIALGKDLPDIEGDMKHGIATFATQMGVQRMAGMVTALICIDYAVAVGFALYFGPGAFNAPLMIGAHVLLACIIVYEYTKVRQENLHTIKVFYQRMWRNVYAEFILFLLI